MTRQDNNRLYYMGQELRTLSLELEQLRNDRKCTPIRGALADIDRHVGELRTLDLDEIYKEMCAYLDEHTARLQYIENSESKNGYTDKYDMYTAGTYCGTYTEHNDHFNSNETKEYYKEKILDKFHKYVSVLYYIMHALPIDMRKRYPVPVSACEEPWLLDER